MDAVRAMISNDQALVLRKLRDGARRVPELSFAPHASGQYVRRFLQRMAADGLVTPAASPGARVLWWKITEAGEQALALHEQDRPRGANARTWPQDRRL